MLYSRIAATLLVILITVAITGCDSTTDGPKRFDVSGNVTFDGKPVDYGSITFTPDTSKQNSGPQGTAKIRDGKYDTSNDGRGVVGGPHQVIITGMNKDVEDITLENRSPPPFPEYTTEVDLPKETSTQDFKVPATK